MFRPASSPLVLVSRLLATPRHHAGRGISVNPVTCDILTKRAKQLGNLPAMPRILATLAEALQTPVSQVDVGRIVQTISYDKSLAAQCLRMANSALYRQRGDVSTVSEAVLTLGLWRIRDLVFSCTLPQMFASLKGVVPKEILWRHSLGTAILAEKLARDFAMARHDQVYVAGLLHDIGILINALLFPGDFREVMRESAKERAAISVAERRVLGFTHAESGRALAEAWKLPKEVADAIEFHHRPDDLKPDNEIALIVAFADQLCLANDVGYGYELRDEDKPDFPALWQVLVSRFPKANSAPASEYEVECSSTLAAAQALADQVFGRMPART